MSVQPMVEQPTTRPPVRPDRQTSERAVAALAALLAVPVFALASLHGDTGAEITAGLADDVVPLTVAATLAVWVAAGLFVAAARLGRVIGGGAGRVVTTAGAGVAVTYAAYYAVFGAGAVVAAEMLSRPGPGLGEAAALLLNVVELTRYAPGLALVLAAVVGCRRLPRGSWVPAALLSVVALVPVTSWVAALLVPVWLGASAALVKGSPSPTGDVPVRG